jgi:HAD superfamily hydrolase (TIGR01509 family)
MKCCQVVNSVVGLDRRNRFDVVMAGDDVPRKKPDPIIYQMASERVGVPPERCVVIEDSLVGLRAAKGAGIKHLKFCSSKASKLLQTFEYVW